MMTLPDLPPPERSSPDEALFACLNCERFFYAVVDDDACPDPGPGFFYSVVGDDYDRVEPVRCPHCGSLDLER